MLPALLEAAQGAKGGDGELPVMPAVTLVWPSKKTTAITASMDILDLIVGFWPT